MAENILVLGGIRSGKTALAEQMAADSGAPVTYVATATAGDDEMARRIKRHQSLRPDEWGLVEEPISLAHVLDSQSSENCLLVDCMSLWLSNLLHAGDEVLALEKQRFIDTLNAHAGPVVIVSNEVGLGTIGMDPLTRRFCDELGWLNQALARVCDRVVMSVAGLPLTLKAPA
ncbi:bifunctional adenosylcobinamide kinase/adenosylcobinamide-phosphate guanylyltransferase [Marinobacter sp. R17]|uniref:bifunctional adenosylcobinamide kinase/adenosylcobinamide-phosphate guanylyltransferase n=1 Tax=Marinobacter sp. R17 TaxID=2484250 RepID=UPI000F4BBCED|nr:bifunctional adenosylcobinamide kinase/adenosylcobinamide-phosphate guanylyltransferase [Marinobacter sp. R17]ROU00043.1 bifunctional adenosylcobinamide kinase/adenosylcobinamide-phosphate guanylyltransferase [Marinobacter sp. R17]